MKRLMFLWLLSVVAVFGQPVADSFCYPVSPYSIDGTLSARVDCGYSGQKPGVYYLGQGDSGQRFLQYNDSEWLDTHRYHLGTDLNGSGGGDTDLGDPIFVPANGRVILVRDTKTSDSWGRVVVIRHKLPTGQGVYSLYGHMASIDSGIKFGADVYKGAKLGTIGDAGGTYLAHLHFEMFLEPRVPQPTNRRGQQQEPSWDDAAKYFRGYIDSPDSTNVHGSIDPIFFIKTEMAKHELGIQTGLFLTRAPLQPGGCAVGGSGKEGVADTRNYILNQFTSTRTDSIFVIRRSDTYKPNVLPVPIKDAAAQGMVTSHIWERIPNDTRPDWNPIDVADKPVRIVHNYWVCPDVEVDVAHYAHGWHKFSEPDENVTVFPFFSPSSKEEVRDGRALAEYVPSGTKGSIVFRRPEYRPDADNDDKLSRAYVRFDATGRFGRQIKGYVRQVGLVPEIELTDFDYPLSVCIGPVGPALSFGKVGFQAKFASLGGCEEQPPRPAQIALSDTYCDGTIPKVVVGISEAEGADRVRVYRDNVFMRELTPPYYPFPDQGEAGRSYTYTATAWNDEGSSESERVTSNIFPNCEAPPPPPPTSGNFTVTTGNAYRERVHVLMFEGTIYNPDDDVTWWFEFAGSPTGNFNKTQDSGRAASPTTWEVQRSWDGFVCDQTVYYRLVATNGTTTNYGSTLSVNSGPCAQLPELGEMTVGKSTDPADVKLSVLVNPNGDKTEMHFRYGWSPDNLVYRTPYRGVGDGTEWLWYPETFSIQCGATFYFRAYAKNDFGQAESDLGTGFLPCPGAPILTNFSITQNNYGGNVVTFRATVEANGSNTDSWFEWGFMPEPWALNRTAGQFSVDTRDYISDFRGNTGRLWCGETVYVRAVAENADGRTHTPILQGSTSPCD